MVLRLVRTVAGAGAAWLEYAQSAGVPEERAAGLESSFRLELAAMP